MVPNLLYVTPELCGPPHPNPHFRSFLGPPQHSFSLDFFFLLLPKLQGFLGGSDGKESACSARDLGLIPRLGRSPGQENGNPLRYSCLENSMAFWPEPPSSSNLPK